MTETTGTATSHTPGSDWLAWQDSWDRQQQHYLPDREERFATMLDMVEAVVGSEPRVLDLACGTGSISQRLLKRFPNAVSTGVDLDPALLAIARGTFEGDDRVTFVTADLKDPDWPAALPYDAYDAVLTSTALHWLRQSDIEVLYGRIAGLVREGGVFMSYDHMPFPDTPRINEVEVSLRLKHMERAKSEGAADWREWWELAGRDPLLAEPTARRFEIFGEHADGEMPPAEWHARTLREAGFAEARPVCQSFSDTLVLGLK